MKATIRISRLLIVVTAFLIAMNAFGNEPRFNPSRQYTLLENVLSKYEAIASKGGWEKITGSKKFYQQGESALAIQQLKARLRATGDLTVDDNSTYLHRS
jgi:cell shape-determining protein MreC